MRKHRSNLLPLAALSLLGLGACGGPPVTPDAGPTCATLGKEGTCEGTQAVWCDGTSPTTVDCAAFQTGGTSSGATCATTPAPGAWCAVGLGKTCVVQGETRGSYLLCGDQAGLLPATGCDLNLGCVHTTATCSPVDGGSFAASCSGDVLVLDCTPWGQPVQRDCTSAQVGGTGCQQGACVGLGEGQACDAQSKCHFGFDCNSTTHKCEAAPFTPFSHPAVAQVVTLGGPVLAHPKVKMISWSTDPNQSVGDGFVQDLTVTPYWNQVVGEYGVGALTVSPPAHLAGGPGNALTDSQVQQLIQTNTSGANPAWGAADPNTIYTVMVPDGTSFDDGSGSRCCVDYDGYHDELRVGATTVPYSIVCLCPGFDGPTETDAQQLTVVISHELVEAATDPIPNSNPAFAETDDDHAIWTVGTGGEIGDMCSYQASANVFPAGAIYMVQRIWSNAAAAAGNDPCVPASGPYAAVEPVLRDQASIQYGGPWPTRSVKIPVNQSATIDLPVFTNAAMSPVTVAVYDLSKDYMGGTRLLNLTLNKTTANNGDVLKLTIVPNGFDSQLGGAGFVVETTWPGGGSLAMGVVTP
jgi:hypothetical protein